MKMKLFAVAAWLGLLAAFVLALTLRGNDSVARAQAPGQIELACPAGYVPLPYVGQSYDAATQKWRQIFCNNSAGLVFVQPDNVAGAIPGITGSFTPGDLLTVSSANPLVMHDGGAVPGAIQFPVAGFISNALTSVGFDAGFFTFPQARTLKQWGIQLITAPAGCSTSAVITIQDATSSKELGRLTLANGNGTYLAAGSIENSGTVNAGDSLQLGEVFTAPAGCTTNPAGEQFLAWFQ